MKLNNKGFAITSIIYSMLILFLTLVVLIISNLASRKVVFDKQKEEIMNKFEEYENIEDGTVVYFDVTTGKVCNNYHEDNSKPGYNGISSTKTTSDQNGCLKFYVFQNYEDEQRLNLLLDHNTTATVNWDDSGDNQYGPRTLLAKLQDDTGSWVGTEQPSNYTDTLINKTINYEGYKARLITEEDIYNITGVPNIYFFTADGNQTETCREGDNSGCLYRWLYDSMDVNGGYWAANADLHSVNNVDFARIVRFETFNANGVSETSYQGESLGYQHYGLRPVIEVSRSKIINKFESTLLPAEYQQVEYIKSSGTQRILTNIIPNDKTGLKIEWLFYENQDQVVVLGTDQFWFGHQGDTLVFGWNEPIFNDVMPVETKLDVRLNYMNDRKMQYSYKEDSEVHSSSQPITKTLNNQTQSIEIFFGDVHIKLYSLVITQESQTIANFIPCYRKSDNVIGLYDLVENEFYTNSGTGNFQIGPKV